MPSTPNIPPGFVNVALFTRDDSYVTDAYLPPFKPLPEVVIWGERVFVRRQPDAPGKAACYVEAFTFVVPLGFTTHDRTL